MGVRNRGPEHRDLQTWSLVPVPWLRGGGGSPCVAGCPSPVPPLLAGAAAAAQAPFHGRVYLLECHSAVLSEELLVPAQSPCPNTRSTPFLGDEPRTRSQHIGQGMGLNCDPSSFIGAWSFGCLERTLPPSCWHPPCRRALLPASPCPEH